MSFQPVGNKLKNVNIVSEADPDFEEKATPQVRAAVERSRKKVEPTEFELDRVGLNKEVRARYKIEITFGPKRTHAGPNEFGVQIWESGKMFHGGGDALMFWCKDSRPGQDSGCWSPIPSSNINQMGVAFCPGCKKASNAELLTSARMFRLTTAKTVEVLMKMFRQLGSNADFYIKYHRTDIRFQAMLKEKGLETANRLKGMNIYPLKNILKDTANGASLEKRLLSFITA